MTAGSMTASMGATLHALAVGAAVAIFVFILCWAGEAAGFYPPASRLVELFTDAAELRTANTFWRGAASAAALGAVVGALIAISSDALSRLAKQRR